jgi:polyribonucleotide nucleotidyltransferase
MYSEKKSISQVRPSSSKPVKSPARPMRPQDFFPLTVNYQEKTYAAGRIPGGYFKREGRPTEKETLVSRLIDRPIRPLFVEGFKNEVQVIVTVLQHDMENDPTFWRWSPLGRADDLRRAVHGPDRRARVGYINGEAVLNPTIDEMKTSDQSRPRRRRHAKTRC